MTTRGRSVLALAAFVLGCLAAGGLGAVLSGEMGGGEWYAALERPPLTPPSWVFGPVWTTLYVLMGVAAWLVWRHYPCRGTLPALTLFFVQLALNVAWSPLFFGLHNPTAALVDLAALWVALVATTVLFFRVSIAAGVLLLPYLVWTTFAAYLNIAIVALN